MELLGQEAINLAGKRRLDAAADAPASGLHLTRSLEQEPVLISFLVRVPGLAILQRDLEKILNQRTLRRRNSWT